MAVVTSIRTLGCQDKPTNRLEAFWLSCFFLVLEPTISAFELMAFKCSSSKLPISDGFIFATSLALPRTCSALFVTVAISDVPCSCHLRCFVSAPAAVRLDEPACGFTYPVSKPSFFPNGWIVRSHVRAACFRSSVLPDARITMLIMVARGRPSFTSSCLLITMSKHMINVACSS